MCFSPLWSGVFVNVIRYGKRMNILSYSVLFCLLKSKINPFLRIQFSRLLSRGKGKIYFPVFLQFTKSVGIIQWLALHTYVSSLPRDSSETFQLTRQTSRLKSR